MGLPPASGDSTWEARRRAAAILTAAGRAALFVGGALPWLIALWRSYFPLGKVGIALDLLFVPMCHRLPDRTLRLAGVAMPLCSRCAGIFAGIAIGSMVARPWLPLARWRGMIAVTGALMALDVVTQDVGLHAVWHPTRLLTGLLFGYAVAVTCVTALRGQLDLR